ncbi:MAG: DUF1036 domain-containing protein [Pseudomonadota bacterium]
MLAAILLSLSAALAQPPGPFIVELCNETPARAAFTLVRPISPSAEVQRGWFTVEPGDCLQGGVGQAMGARAWAHARSGDFIWPAGDAARSFCTPANSHDGPPAAAPCSASARQAGHDVISVQMRGGVRHVRYAISCDALAPSDAALCVLGRRDAQGFAAPVRELEVCNRADGPLRVAVAGQAGAGPALSVSGWRMLEPGRCQTLWRGFSDERRAYLRAVRPGGQAVQDMDAVTLCADAGADFNRIAERADETQCAQPGLEPLRFRSVLFGEGVSRLTVDIDDAF